jgi:hypothetical protein
VETWAQLIRDARSDLGALVAGRAHVSPELAKTHDDAIALIEGKGDVGDAAAQGALSALLLGRLRDRLVAHWLETKGPGFATACAAYERRWVAAHLRKAGGIDLKVRFLAVRAPEQIAIALDIPTWQVLAPAFKKLRVRDRDAEQEIVRAARKDLPLPAAAYIDGIALLSEEAAADVLAIAGEPALWSAHYAQLVTMLPALALEPSDATREAMRAILAEQRVGLVNFVAPYVKSVTDGLEDEDAARALARILRDAHGDSTANATEAKKVATALAGIDSSITEEFFATHVGSRLVGEVAADYVASHETRASTKAQAAAVKQHDDNVALRLERSKRAKKAARSRVASAKVEKVLAEAPVADADAASIPWILREPPWRGSIAPFPRGEFSPIAFEERVHWTEEEAREADEDDPVRDLVAKGAEAIDRVIAMGDDGFQALRSVESPRVAVAMLGVLGGKRAPLAMRWFVDFPEATAIGLGGMLMRGEGDARELLRILGHVIAEGRARELEKTLAECGVSASEVLFAARLMRCPDGAYQLPLFAFSPQLPLLLLKDGTKLPPNAVRSLLEMIAFSERNKPYAGLALARQALDGVALDRFLVALEEAARRSGLDDDWPQLALATLGGPDAMRAVLKQVREWNRSNTTRDLALDTLDAMENGGRDAAAALTDFLRRGAGGLVGDRAAHVLRVIAKREGLSEDELADMSTPSLELAADGTVTLDMGPRKVRVVLGDDLSATLIDENGAKLSSLRALKTDDPVKARASLDRFKSLKKALGETARAGAARLEQSMAAARDFEMPIFRDYVAHPILGRLARRFVWARVDKKTGGVASTFRVSEDGSFANTNDDAVLLAVDDRVRVLHPMETSAQTLARWADIFADYEVIQPFPQLGRPTFTPTKEELVDNALSRFKGKEAMQMAIMGRLVTRGWEKLGEPYVTGYVKRLRGMTAQYMLADTLMPGSAFQNETTIGVVTFGMPVGKVAPIAFSEIAYDLHVFEEPHGK